jgi:uncharacterized protein (TIGR03437 family)
MRQLRILTAALYVYPALLGAAVPTYLVQAVAGNGGNGDGGMAVSAQIGAIQGIAYDSDGGVYLSDTDHHRVRHVSTAGVIRTVAGTGTAGFAGDGGRAASAKLNTPYGLAVSADGSLYIADLGNGRVRRVSPNGLISTVAGTGARAVSADGIPATAAALLSPRNVLADRAGNLYISEFEGHRIRRVSASGLISTVAGTGAAGFSGDGAAASEAQLAYPAGLAMGPDGSLYVADSGNQRVRRFLVGGSIATAVGASQTLLTPSAVAVDGAGQIYVADATSVVHELLAAGDWVVVAGTGTAGFSGDGAAATSARLSNVHDVAWSSTAGLYLADGARLRRVNLLGGIETLAGDNYTSAIGDDGAAGDAYLLAPRSVALDNSGSLLIADTGLNRVRMVSSTGTILTLAGTGATGLDRNSAATDSPLTAPAAAATRADGVITIADTGNHTIRSIGSDGLLAVLAGTGVAGAGKTGQVPVLTALRSPAGVCPRGVSDTVVADTGNNRLLLVPVSGPASSVAGTGTAGYTGDGFSAAQATLNQPTACATGSDGSLYIADTGNHAVRKVSAAGLISTLAGTGVEGYSGDGAAATAAQLSSPRGVAIAADGTVFIADTGNHRIRAIATDGTISTTAGTGMAGSSGDGGLATSATISSPGGLAVDASGDVYFADTGNDRVRRLVPTATSSASAAVTGSLTVTSAATMSAGAIAPGELLSVFGSGIGPATPRTGELDPFGLLAAELSGAKVLFDGVAAPVLYARSNQINLQAPYAIAGKSSVHVAAYLHGSLISETDAAVVPAAPGLFAVALSASGGFNSQSAPAAPGSILTIYGTGEGMTDGINESGRPAFAPWPKPLLPVGVTIGGVTAELLYAGEAPALIGMIQINLKVPESGLSSGAADLIWQVGGYTSAPMKVWIQ